MKKYDLITDSCGISVYNEGILEKTFRLSLLKTEQIKTVFCVSAATGDTIGIRYSAGENAEKYENYIDSHYTRTGESVVETLTK